MPAQNGLLCKGVLSYLDSTGPPERVFGLNKQTNDDDRKKCSAALLVMVSPFVLLLLAES